MIDIIPLRFKLSCVLIGGGGGHSPSYPTASNLVLQDWKIPHYLPFRHKWLYEFFPCALKKSSFFTFYV